MRAFAQASPLVALLVLSGQAWSEERNRFADVLALQEAVRQSIERAEPAIACIRVSRSERYREFGVLTGDLPGKLGRYQPARTPSGASPQPDPLDLSNPDNVPELYGSGVVLDDRAGLILTQAHIIRKAVKVYVRLPGGKGSYADIQAADPRSDLAVLRLLDPPADLQAIKLGDGGKLHKGDFVLSLANPFDAGFRDGSPSASWGIVSNLRRRSTGQLSEYEKHETGRRPLSFLVNQKQNNPRQIHDPDRRAPEPGLQRRRPAQPAGGTGRLDHVVGRHHRRGDAGRLRHAAGRGHAAHHRGAAAR
jgi:S1-C subfamily serine protease